LTLLNKMSDNAARKLRFYSYLGPEL